MKYANDPSLTSWIPVAPDSDFPIQNLPFGIFKTATLKPRIGVAIGEYILDLTVLWEKNYLRDTGLKVDCLEQASLNSFIALGKPVTNAVRSAISIFLRKENEPIENKAILWSKAIVKQSEATMLLPVSIPNYTDFYSSKEHATNVGMMFRDPANALLPNWLHIPVGYHGRASSIVVSGTPIKRPMGQTKTDVDASPSFGPTKSLDFELEMGFITGRATVIGDSISTADAPDYIFGLVLFNDWSARDIQRWEYVPLGPFLAKNFGSTMSPWVVTLEALEPFKVAGPVQEPPVLPYLQYASAQNYDIQLSVSITSASGASKLVSDSNFKFMYWNMAQQLAHHTVNGCNICVGDLYASGTISGPSPDSYGSMLELTWGGKNPIAMPDGTERKFILDGDTVTMCGWCERDGIKIGFGECNGKILPNDGAA